MSAAAEAVALPRVRVVVREIRVVGSTIFSAEELARVTAPYVNREVTAEDLEALRLALTRLYVDRGYVSSGAILPDQPVSEGVITYQIVEGSLKAVEVEGNRWFRSSYFTRRFSLAGGPPLGLTSTEIVSPATNATVSVRSVQLVALPLRLRRAEGNHREPPPVREGYLLQMPAKRSAC